MSDRQFPPQSTATLALLFPVGVIAAFTLGRAVGNLALVALLGFAIYLLVKFRIKPTRWGWLIAFYLLVPLVSLFLYGQDRYEGLWVWTRLVLVLISTLVVSHASPDQGIMDERTAKTLFFMWALALFVYVLRACYWFSTGDFIPSVQLNGLHVAALLPLAMVAVEMGVAKSLGYAGLSLAILAVGDSRTEVLMVLVAVAAILAFYYRRMPSLLLAIPFAFGISMAYGYFWRGYRGFFTNDVFDWFNSLTGGRLILWSLVVAHPPENPIIGVGIGQSPYYLEIHGYPTLSFHNVFVETWYDGGWIWLGLLFLGILKLSSRLPINYQHLTGRARWIYSCYFGSLLASFVACMTDRGYSTALFNVLMVYCLVILYRYDNASMHVTTDWTGR